MKIITLTAENVKRLKAVDITPAEHVQIVAGRNAQGKSSVLDAIWLALGGGPAARGTSRPIRDGEDKASVRLDLGDLVVTRTWTGDKTALKVESADGAKYGSPQGVLDALVGRLSFDPLEFTRLSARDQVAALLDLVDIEVDLGALAFERQKTYDARTEIGREGKALDGQLAGLGKVEDAPDAEVSAVDLIARIRSAEQQHREHTVLLQRYADLSEEVESRRAELRLSEAELTNVTGQKEAVTSLPDLGILNQQVAGVEETNAAVRRNTQRADVANRISLCRSAFKAATTTIEQIDQSKAAALAKAKFPVDGLSFDDLGVSFGGIPFSQASSAEQIRVSLAMAMSLNPKLRVIRILDGSLLDAENLALIEDMARDNDYQVWIERVGNADGIGVVIEDGEVAL